jgi:mRNA interferase MazF
LAAGKGSLKRGDVVIAAGGGGFGGKPRPYVVVQSNDHRATTLILVGCHGLGATRVDIRPLLHPSAQNGLLKISEVTVDTPVTMRIERIDKLIGRLSEAELDAVDAALLIILGLVGERR